MAAPSAFLPVILLLFFFFFLPRQSLCLRTRPNRLIVPDPSPESFPPIGAPAPTSGGDLPRLPSEGVHALSPVGYSSDPLQPASRPTPSEAPSSESGSAIPFISSSPAVPIPTGITDTASILPLPSPGGNALATGQGSLIQIQLMWALILMIFSFWAST
ncbi:Cupredoxin superfamily protein [Rhynchospora pubera]|uniref:Cupredoxin superfamily protein n=1 Tax=Rhynchospora pubera TaxID=906938 RepID=A0AAV8CQL9_9POAL|nr:Cupredoxin superfamily protein [Rhynchospora pubera]